SLCVSVIEEEEKTEKHPEVEDMEISTRSRDAGSTERMAQKRKVPSPSPSSNGHSPADTSPCPVKKKKKPGAVSSSKDQKITVAECIETQSKAMMMLTTEQLSYLLKFALQKMKQPGTEPFQKPVSLEQHPDYAEYIFHPMDLCTLEKVRLKRLHIDLLQSDYHFFFKEAITHCCHLGTLSMTIK
uniref:Zinc finger MYND-type containing 8 n=1 Tax=Fundulus heteroclitus TaxID=8078 RepID=A0A3Q2UM29_FUNHE